MNITPSTLLSRAETIGLTRFHLPLQALNANQLHHAVSSAAMEAITPTWIACEEKCASARRAYYLSAEYLVGRMVYNNLYALGILDEVTKALEERGISPALMEDVEDDAFGNGGLGRLAACFLDSAATHAVPLTGYGLRYRYGLFKQSFVSGRQHEEPDDWSKFGDPWSIRRDDRAVVVPMKCGNVRAVPYDMPVIGFGGENIGTLRLWQCESLHEIDFVHFNNQEYRKASADKNAAEDITKFLYPNDTRREGRMMRVKQQYVMVSASLQDMLHEYTLKYGHDFSHFAALHAVQLNDTHPVMAIPELIRLLMQENMTFDDAFAIARNVFSYTNHTVMQEALEKWDLTLLNSVCPSVVQIIRLIDARFKKEMLQAGHKVQQHCCIVWNKQVHMAQLAVYATHTTNGVAQLHSQILKDDVFADWYSLYPDRFQNKTNGITQRRWLGLCNPQLCRLIESRLKHRRFITQLDTLIELEPMIDDALAEDFIRVKFEKKRQLAEIIYKEQGITISPNMIFDVQIKRLHEYKRQLMNALSIWSLYMRIKRGEIKNFTPTAFIFGAKAAPGYVRAKAVIHLINKIAETINADPEMNSVMKVVFVHNYNCSWAEKIIPAADVSEQISPAGTEASGTGNMKLMLNGAVTLGTYDGANIEIVQEAGQENNYIFGATVDELNDIRPHYRPRDIYDNSAIVKEAVDVLLNAFPDEDGTFRELYDALLDGASWHQPDHYFVLQDLTGYMDARMKLNREYTNRIAFSKKCLFNIAHAGKFSSDRTIQQYAREIWKV